VPAHHRLYQKTIEAALSAGSAIAMLRKAHVLHLCLGCVGVIRDALEKL